MEKWRFDQAMTQRMQVKGIANLQWAAEICLGAPSIQHLHL